MRIGQIYHDNLKVTRDFLKESPLLPKKPPHGLGKLWCRVLLRLCCRVVIVFCFLVPIAIGMEFGFCCFYFVVIVMIVAGVVKVVIDVKVFIVVIVLGL